MFDDGSYNNIKLAMYGTTNLIMKNMVKIRVPTWLVWPSHIATYVALAMHIISEKLNLYISL